jgi:hypothetical protein
MSAGLYVFIATSDDKILGKGKELQAAGLGLLFSDAVAGASLYGSGGQGIPHYLSVINDLQDFSIADEIKRVASGQPASPDSDSLVSFAHAGDGRFVARTDLYGVQRHYYYRDERTFICSNNALIVARLADAPLERETMMFEYLFFMQPARTHTYFAGVSTLLPGEGIACDLASRKVSLTAKVDLYADMTTGSSGKDLVPAATDFFRGAAKVLQGRKTVVSLSAGSDSLTVLAGTLASGMDVSAVTYGGDDFVETQFVRDLAARRGFPVDVQNFAGLLSNWEQSFKSAALVTSGVISCWMVHYGKYYRAMQGDALFEGFAGSEFLKAEIVPGGTTATPVVKVISGGLTVADAIQSCFGFLPADFRARMAQYISDTYGSTLLPVRTPEGRREYARFMFDFLPSHVFGAVHNLASLYRPLYLPFYSRRIQRVLQQTQGITKFNSLPTGGYPGSVGCMKAERVLVKQFDAMLYASRIDRLYSFKEADELPVWLVDALRRIRGRVQRRQIKGMVPGQVHTALVQGFARGFVDANDQLVDHSLFGGKVGGDNLIRERSKLIVLRQLMDDDLRTLVGGSAQTAGR